MKKRDLLLFIGDSGSGKTTQAEKIVELHPDRFSILVSTATRDIRVGEVEGRDYYYVSIEEFHKRAMIESVEFPANSGKFYGVQASEFERISGDMLLVVEPNGALQIKAYVERHDLDINVVIIYMDIPKNEIRKTLLAQKIPEEEVEARLSRGDIPGDFTRLGLTADLSVKRLNSKTAESIIEWLDFNNEIYG